MVNHRHSLQRGVQIVVGEGKQNRMMESLASKTHYYSKSIAVLTM